METINVVPDRWLTSQEAAAYLRISQRTVQNWGKTGKLKTKPAGAGNPSAKLYDPKDVQRHMPTEPKAAPARSHHKREDTAVAKRADSTEARFGHALETINIVGQMLAAQKAERDAEREERAAKAAAEHERLKWEREDAKERWDAEQKRLEAERQREEARARPWLTLDEAMACSGLSRADLLLLCRQEKLTARKAGGWRILRRSLEAFTEGVCGPQAVRKASA